MATTHLNEEQLRYFKDRLLKMKKTTTSKLSDEDDESPQDEVHEISDFQNHPADQGTELFEQELNEGLDNRSRERLEDINDALHKIENNTYGLSEISDKPIPVERLEARPTARNLVEEEEDEEKQQ